ncbi:MAG: class I SAM-dependent methyltransferase [Sphingomicrobium sp.]
MMAAALSDVRDFWNAASCGEALLLPEETATGYAAQSTERYRLEPYIPGFANWGAMRGKKVLEIGVGMGSDHEQFARAGADLSGIDLTPRAVDHTRRRLSLAGLHSDLQVGNAEALPFAEASFDHVYSWGVLHHSPDTPKAIAEAMRVLRPGGTFAMMVYNKWSLVGLMLWARYGLARGRPLTSLASIYANYLESPGTKAYTPSEALRMVAPFASKVEVRAELTHGDLLSSGAGQRHQGRLLDLARTLWPRGLLKRLAAGNGLFLLISGQRK